MDSAPQPKGFRQWLAHAFAIEAYDESSLSAEERALLDRIADKVAARRGFDTAAIAVLQANRHMNWLTSQALVFLSPLHDLAYPILRHLGIQLPPADVVLFSQALEKRYSIEYLIRRIEARGSDWADEERNG